MPEALQATTRKQVSAIVGESSCPANNDHSNDAENDVWGFKITGGVDFGIPITVFHVSIFCILNFNKIYIPTCKKMDRTLFVLSVYIYNGV